MCVVSISLGVLLLLSSLDVYLLFELFCQPLDIDYLVLICSTHQNHYWCVFINEFTTPLLSILGVTTTLCYELLVQLWQLIAHHQGWLSRWLETDSMLVSLAFKYSKIVPWSLQNRWSNCLHLLFSMNFHVSRIYKEGNKCADTLANLGLTLASYCWFSQPPPHIRINLESNKLGLPNFRFS